MQLLRNDFPIFRDKTLVFLDSASSAQKPQAVIDSMTHFLSNGYANIHRGAYDLSSLASEKYNESKKMVAKFLNAESFHEIVFTYNATYAFNLIARSLAASKVLQKGDTILLSEMEHHANIVPWQIIQKEYEINIIWAKVDSNGLLNYRDLEEKIPKAKIISLSGASNVTGEILDIERVSNILKKLENRPIFIIDGSQRFGHIYTDVQENEIDIFVGTGHKIMSDTGIGFFYMKKSLQKQLQSAFCGGGAINTVCTSGYTQAGIPLRFEPGTPHIVGAVSLLSALQYIENIGGYRIIENYENILIEYALQKISKLPNEIKLLGSNTKENRLGVFSFVFKNHHPNDVAEFLADKNICVRSGHHCTEPLHIATDTPASLRMSLYFYNTKEDIDIFFQTITEFLQAK